MSCPLSPNIAADLLGNLLQRMKLNSTAELNIAYAPFTALNLRDCLLAPLLCNLCWGNMFPVQTYSLSMQK